MAAFTVTTLTPGPKHDRIINQAVTRYLLSATSDDISACEEIIAAPGAGYRIVIERLIVCIGAAITVTVGSGETGPGSVEGDKITLGGAAGTYNLDFGEEGIEMTANKSLTADASGAGTVCIVAKAFVRTV